MAQVAVHVEGGWLVSVVGVTHYLFILHNHLITPSDRKQLESLEAKLHAIELCKLIKITNTKPYLDALPHATL